MTLAAPATLAALLAGCGADGGATSGAAAARPPLPEPVAQTCATRLPVRASPTLPQLPGSPPAFVAPLSTIVVHAEVPLGGVRQLLEAKVPRRVAEERDRDIGAAGRLEYTVDRGPFTVRAESDALVVEAMLHGRAQACAKGRCYAGCSPEARVTAKVPFHLGVDYKLRTSDVRIDVIRGCQVRALGGFITIDVTPMLRAALAQQSRGVQASIDRELPDFRAQATRLWSELQEPRALPLGMCVVLAPEAIAQGPASGTAEVARLRFGLLARPEVRVKCTATATATGAGTDAATATATATATAAGARALPPLRDDPALPAAGDVHLAMALGDDAPARAVERAAETLDFGGRRARVSKASGDATSGLLVDLSGEVCGDVAMTIHGVAWDDAQSLHLTGAAPAAGEAERLATVGLDGAPVVTAVQRAPLALPIALSALPALLPGLASTMSDGSVAVSATVESARGGSAGFRGADVIAVALLRGAVTLRLAAP